MAARMTKREKLEEIFTEIHDFSSDQYRLHKSINASMDLEKQLLKEKEERFDYLKQKGNEQAYKEYLDFSRNLSHKRNQRPRYTAKQFWHGFLTLPIYKSGQKLSLIEFISNDFEDLDLGLLRGRIPLRLRISYANLLEMTAQPSLPNYDWIEVPDGAFGVKYLSEPLPKGLSRVPVTGDGPLRRFMEIGSVMCWQCGDWEATGHILVVDLDKDRQRHPWFILCDQWGDSWGESVFAAPTVEKVDSETPGVFPPDRNRTTIAKLVDGNDNRTRSNDLKDPFLLRFGKNFHFDLQRFTDGRDLVRIMMWNRKCNSTMEECYADDSGTIYLEYDRDQDEYVLPERGLKRLPTGFLPRSASQSKKPLQPRPISESNLQPALDSKSASRPRSASH
ncbi:MAG: hypothetical protein Q9167_003637 [Letrouitia subvulpina]